MTETPFTGGIVGESRLRREDPALLFLRAEKALYAAEKVGRRDLRQRIPVDGVAHDVAQLVDPPRLRGAGFVVAVEPLLSDDGVEPLLPGRDPSTIRTRGDEVHLHRWRAVAS